MPGRFLRVRCPDCSNVQVMFDRASMDVKCEVCGTTLAKPSGGRAETKGETVEVLTG